MDILFTNHKLLTINFEAVPRSRSKASTYSYAEYDPISQKDPLQEWMHKIEIICKDCLISCYSKNNCHTDGDTLLLIPVLYSIDINKLEVSNIEEKK